MRKRRGRNRRRRVRLYRRISLILVLTVIYIAAFVVPIFIQQFKAVNVAPDVKLWQEAFDGSTTFVQVFCLLLGLTVLRLFWFILWPLLCVLTALCDYMVSTFHSQISKDSVAVVLESSTREAANFFNFNLLITLISGLSLAILGIVMLQREKKEPRNFRVAAVALLLAIGLITINGGSMSTRFPPYNFLTAASQYATERLNYASTPRKNISEYGAAMHSIGNNPLVIVLVIGESARADHFSINGYNRETTPLLEKRKNLVDFKDTTSCGVWTRISVPCMLTRASASNLTPMYTETSLISLYKSLGFYTAWLGAQNAISYPLIDIIHEADYYNLLEDAQFLDNTVKDGDLLPLMDKVMKKHPGPLLIILHTFGSHWQYTARYPKKFERYTPVCGMTLSRSYNVGVQVAEIRSCTQQVNHQALVNSYDNSVLYTDYFIDQVIHRLENKNALLMYASDHGESLGEQGRFLHGWKNAPENRKVPMFWWASDEFIAAHPERWQALKQKSSAPSSHDVIFHSVLDCSGVSSPLIDPKLSLCHNDGDIAPQAQAPTVQNVPVVYEPDMDDMEQPDMMPESIPTVAAPAKNNATSSSSSAPTPKASDDNQPGDDTADDDTKTPEQVDSAAPNTPVLKKAPASADKKTTGEPQ